MLALPYITEETNFSGAIYLTEPTLHFGRLFMEETIEFLEQRSSKSTQDLGSMPTWKSTSNLPGNLAHISGICKTWKKTYSREQIESCLSKVTLVGFSEQKDILAWWRYPQSVPDFALDQAIGSLTRALKKLHTSVGLLPSPPTLPVLTKVHWKMQIVSFLLPWLKHLLTIQIQWWLNSARQW